MARCSTRPPVVNRSAIHIPFGSLNTSVTHRLDDAVYGHLNVDNQPIGDWKDLHDPRSGKSLDLSFALWEFPVTGINKDLVNQTQFPATALGAQLRQVAQVIQAQQALDALLAGVTKRNRHGEVDFGPAVGREVW